MHRLGHIAGTYDETAARPRRQCCVSLPVLAIFALVLQLFTSSMGMASDGVSGGTWIEICSDFGISYVQVDMSDGPVDHGDCPDCRNCALCGAYASGVTPELGGFAVINATSIATVMRPQAQVSGMAERRAWPETRGPPAAEIDKADRVFCAMTAFIPSNGGAL